MTTEIRTIEFHRAFGHPVRTEPQALGRKEALLALALIEEELRELAEAMFPGITEDPACFYGMSDILEQYPFDYEYKPNLVAIADAVADLDVVVNGAGIRHGFDMQALSREAFDSNMSKQFEDGAHYAENGKILKGPNFREPDFAGALGIEA